jgi:hypothetical protein
MVLAILKTQKFGGLAASNDETVGLLVVLLPCVQVSLSYGLDAAVFRMKLDKPVLFEAVEKFTDVALDNVSANLKNTADFFSDLRLGQAAFQQFKNPRSDDVQGKHLTVVDIEDDAAIRAMRAPNALSNF